MVIQVERLNRTFLKSQTSKHSSPNYNLNLITDLTLFNKEVEKIREKLDNKFTSYVILLEITLFKPYYPLGDNDKRFKDLKIYDERKNTLMLEYFSATLGIETARVQQIKSNYKNAINGISGHGFNFLLGGLVGTVFLAVIAAFATPFIAGLLAPILAPGLYGAAAISAVLAALGGGAIAAGL